MSDFRRNRILAISGASALLLLPILVFRQQTGAMAYYLGEGYPPGQGAYIAMRPAGHIAFTLVFLQILLGQHPRRCWPRSMAPA